MALVEEDGTGKADATTWAGRAALIAYAVARGVVLADEDATDVFLVKAMDRLELETYRGEPVNADQGTPFPRTWYDNTGALGFPNDAVPAPLEKAQLLLAFAASQGIQLTTAIGAGPRVVSRGVGPMRREYERGSHTPLAVVPGVSELLEPYTEGGGGFSLTVRRA